ncbi:MAG TPA: hypothetical protein PKX92_14215 [Edaphocola sp.]|nr:hypothetical protein [Edaphocola sp.]
MKKIKISILAITTFAFTTFSACNKSEITKNKAQEQNLNIKKDKAVGWIAIPIIVGGAWVIIKAIEGQATTVTTTSKDVHGNTQTTTTTTCNGLGACAKTNMATVNNNGSAGSPLSSNYDKSILEDYQVQLKLVRTVDGKILLGTDEVTNENFNRFFYADKINYMSTGDSYIIDNTQVLEKLGLTAPLLINGGEYDVMTTKDGAKYIQVGSI